MFYARRFKYLCFCLLWHLKKFLSSYQSQVLKKYFLVPPPQDLKWEGGVVTVEVLAALEIKLGAEREKSWEMAITFIWLIMTSSFHFGFFFLSLELTNRIF